VYACVLSRELGAVRLVLVPIPHDCRGRFYGAFGGGPRPTSAQVIFPAALHTI
jgi:hypothetical protein